MLSLIIWVNIYSWITLEIKERGWDADMNPDLEKRIAEKDDWTFPECVGLATEFSIKTRAVIAFVMMQGKNYIEGGTTGSNSDPDD